MELLTGKAKEDFRKWYANTDSEIKYSLLTSLFESKRNIEKYAYCIEWFDSVGIYIDIKSKFGQRKQCQRFSFVIKSFNSGFIFNSRKKATTEAIIKANEIYNNKN